MHGADGRWTVGAGLCNAELGVVGTYQANRPVFENQSNAATSRSNIQEKPDPAF